MSTRFVFLLVLGLSLSLLVLACGRGEALSTPVAVIAPTATSVPESGVVGGISPELTRRAVDTLRQRDHMATMVASVPTPTAAPGEELNVPPPSLPEERGVWWYRPGVGDHSGQALLSVHPFGEAIDLLDGRAGGDYFPEIAAENEGLILLRLSSDLAELISAAEPDTASYYSRGNVETILYSRMVGSLAWEAASTSEPYLRIWTTFNWDGIDGSVTYRAGGVGVLDVLYPSEDDSVTRSYVGRVSQIPKFAYFTDPPILERVAGAP